MQMVGKDGFRKRMALRDLMCSNDSSVSKADMLKNITYHATGLMRTMQQRKLFINNHIKKIELARKIIESRPDSKIITFSNNVKMAEAIGIGEVYTGKTSKKKGRTTIEDFNLNKVGVLNTVKKCNEGADVRGLSVAIMLGIDSSKIAATQRRGRVIRFEEGKQAEIFNIIINDTVELEWFRKSHEGSSYITINEEGLEDVLNGKEPRPYKKKVPRLTFRF